MIPFMLLSWRWLVPTLIAAGLAVTIGVQHIRIVELNATIATTTLNIEKQKTEAANQLAAAEAKNREIEAHNAALAAQAEKEHNDALEDIATRDRRIAGLVAANGGLRIKIAGRGTGGNCPVPGAPAATGVPSDAAAGTIYRLPDETSRDILAVGRDANTVVAFAKACADWARSVGGR